MAVSYYKIIEGKRYDRQMLKVVENATVGQEERAIPLEPTKKLYKVMIDGNRITAIEKDTLEYIKNKFTFDPAAEKWLTRKVTAWYKKKKKKKLFSLSSLLFFRSGPIIQHAKPRKKPKKKNRPKTPKTKVTVDLKSIGKRPKRSVKPKPGKKVAPPVASLPPDEVVEPTEQTIKNIHEGPSGTDEVPPVQEEFLEANDRFLSEEPGEVSKDISSAGSPTPVSHFDEAKVKPSSTPGTSIKPATAKDTFKPIEKVTEAGKTPSVPSSRPVRQGGSSLWKWFAIICLLLIPVSFFVGRGFEPTRYNIISKESRPAVKATKSVSKMQTVESRSEEQATKNSPKIQIAESRPVVQVTKSSPEMQTAENYPTVQNGEDHSEELHAILRARDQQIAALQDEIELLKADSKAIPAEVESVSTPQEIKKAETKRKISTALTDQLSDQFATSLIQFDKERLWLTFKPSESYFDVGSSKLNPSLKRALRNFFPDFVETLKAFEKDISEIRFQGHSSSVWRNAKNPSEAFLKNLSLSNARAESALKYCLGLKEVARRRKWLEKRMVSSGFSAQKPVLTQNQDEDPVKSRRITISVGVTAPK